MRYLSQIFQPLITIPKNAKIKNTEITCKSQKLLLECGLVRATSSGLHMLLPLARRALDKLEALVHAVLREAGAQRVALPALTPAGLWARSGRLRDAGGELLRVRDRHDRDYLLAPTHEEAIADLLADVGPLSYKQLPLLLYQISDKYRDELRPKHGLLRAREFSMLDAYGAHGTPDCARATYARVGAAYRQLFDALQLPVYAVEAPPGEMGGSVSHEWQLCAAAGEDALCVCPSCSHARIARDDSRCERCGGETYRTNSIEVAHTFVLGTRYSAPLRALHVPPYAPAEPLVMSCYGIGITRLLAASLEALSTEKALRWPKAIAPYSTLVIGPKEGSHEWAAHGWERVLHVRDRLAGSRARAAADDVLIDDRHSLTIGKRLLLADKMGYPTIVVCGKAALESPPRYEVYESTPSADLNLRLVTLEELLAEPAPEAHVPAMEKQSLSSEINAPKTQQTPEGAREILSPDTRPLFTHPPSLSTAPERIDHEVSRESPAAVRNLPEMGETEHELSPVKQTESASTVSTVPGTEKVEENRGPTEPAQKEEEDVITEPATNFHTEKKVLKMKSTEIEQKKETKELRRRESATNFNIVTERDLKVQKELRESPPSEITQPERKEDNLAKEISSLNMTQPERQKLSKESPLRKMTLSETIQLVTESSLPKMTQSDAKQQTKESTSFKITQTKTEQLEKESFSPKMNQPSTGPKLKGKLAKESDSPVMTPIETTKAEEESSGAQPSPSPARGRTAPGKGTKEEK